MWNNNVFYIRSKTKVENVFSCMSLVYFNSFINVFWIFIIIIILSKENWPISNHTKVISIEAILTLLLALKLDDKNGWGKVGKSLLLRLKLDRNRGNHKIVIFLETVLIPWKIYFCRYSNGLLATMMIHVLKTEEKQFFFPVFTRTKNVYLYLWLARRKFIGATEHVIPFSARI